MIEASFFSWALAIFFITAASLLGISVANVLPWMDSAKKNNLPFFFGLSIGPFILGILSVVSLIILPRFSPSIHLLCIGFMLLLPLIVTTARNGLIIYHPINVFPLKNKGEFAFLVLFLYGSLLLLFLTLLFPLTQNDSLEYATVGRILFNNRTLDIYPVTNPHIDKSGFYGPWTHPPFYVTLIYLMNAIQGHAQEPGLMRLLSPWFALTSCTLQYSLGSFLLNRYAGLLAATLMISTPLFFLGAESGLIDSLPIAGMIASMAAVFALEPRPLLYIVGVGSTMGLSMWTHSQAILFPFLLLPVVLIRTLKFGLIRSLTGAIATFTISILVSLWPYWRNYTLFGSPISDNPTVFALPSLKWAEYFQIARGYDDFMDKVQYGLLKGWFMLDAYSVVFWIMLVSLLLVIVSSFRKQDSQAVLRARLHHFAKPLLILGIYMIGVATSIGIDVDLMIKNERYLLVILPCVALISGICLAMAIEEICVTRITNFINALIFVLIFLQLAMVSRYKWKTLNLTMNQISAPLTSKLKSWPQAQAMMFLKDHTPQDAIIFSLLPADMYYSNRKMISYLDPRLVPFYKVTSGKSGLQALKNLGVDYIHVPDYTIPPLYNSSVQEIISSPNLSSLVFSSEGIQIYKLQDNDNSEIKTQKQNIKPITKPESNWNQIYLANLFGRKGLFRIEVLNESIEGLTLTEAWPPAIGFLRRILVNKIQTPEVRLSSNEKNEILARYILSGKGFVRFLISCSDRQGNLTRNHSIGGILLSEESQTATFERRLFIHPQDEVCRFIYEHRASQEIYGRNFEIERIASDLNNPP